MLSTVFKTPWVQRLSASILKVQTRTVSTCDLCDKFEDQLSYATSIFRDFGGSASFEGKIETVQCLEDNSFVKDILQNEAGQNRVLVVDGGGSFNRALAGDQIALCAVKNGWRGIVVNGCIRDSKEIGTMNLGVKALGTTPRKTKRRNNGIRGIPVQFAGITFVPGDYIVADEDGIVVGKIDLFEEIEGDRCD